MNSDSCQSVSASWPSDTSATGRLHITCNNNAVPSALASPQTRPCCRANARGHHDRNRCCQRAAGVLATLQALCEGLHRLGEGLGGDFAMVTSTSFGAEFTLPSASANNCPAVRSFPTPGKEGSRGARAASLGPR